MGNHYLANRNKLRLSSTSLSYRYMMMAERSQSHIFYQ